MANSLETVIAIVSLVVGVLQLLTHWYNLVMDHFHREALRRREQAGEEIQVGYNVYMFEMWHFSQRLLNTLGYNNNNGPHNQGAAAVPMQTFTPAIGVDNGEGQGTGAKKDDGELVRRDDQAAAGPSKSNTRA